jgi:hypothetical protein
MYEIQELAGGAEILGSADPFAGTEVEATAPELEPAEPARGGETGDTRYGRAAHIGLQAELGNSWDYEVDLGVAGRADAVNWEERTIVELKPDNPAAVRLGERQLARYINALEEETGQKWTGYVMRYVRYNGRH